jgi:hypothetical protein
MVDIVEQPVEPQQARRAIEALRAGVPNRDAIMALGSAAPQVEDRFQRLLSAAMEHDDSLQGQEGFLVAGNFGSGKSHLLGALQHRALAQHFVTSKVVISKETPLYDPLKFFQAAMGAARVPERRGAALGQIAEELNPRSEHFLQFFTWVQQARPEVLNQRFAATLYLFEEARNRDPELLEKILAFWGGAPVALADIKRALRAQRERTTYVFDPIDLKALALQRFRFVARLIYAAGYRGWILLVDEVELIGRYSVNQRGRSYAELARWTGASSSEQFPGILSVFAITSDYETAVLDLRHDRDNVPNRLRASSREADQALALQAERGMRVISRPVRLPQPTKAMVGRVYQQVRALHGIAYGWQPPRVGSPPFASSTSMREYIRWWITEWDLVRLYPGYTPRIEVTPLVPDLSEDADLEAGAEVPEHVMDDDPRSGSQ